MFITKALAADTSILQALDEAFSFIGGLENIFVFGLAVGGALALATIMYGGVKYAISGDDPGKKKDAKEWIFAAVKGIAIIAAGAIIIGLINPNLLNVGDIVVSESSLDLSGPAGEQDLAPARGSDALGVIVAQDTGEVISVGESVIMGDGEITVRSVPPNMTLEEFVSGLRSDVISEEITEVDEIIDNSTSDEDIEIVIKLNPGADSQAVANDLLDDFIPQVSEATASSFNRPYPGRWILRGSTGEEVEWIQEKLNITINGSFDSNTETAVRNFQSSHEDADGKPLEVDGIVGPLTWEALFGRAPIAEMPTVGSGESPSGEEIRTLPILSPSGSKAEIPRSVYGYRSWRSCNAHHGVDFDTKNEKGWPLYAIADGKVAQFSGADHACGCGFYLYFNVGSESYRAVYCHIDTESGARHPSRRSDCRYATGNNINVKAGDLLGYSGKTGNASTCHLHFGLSKKINGRYRSINVNYWLDENYPDLHEKKTRMEEPCGKTL
ncbi:MAG: peptidoglycan DD-metalloendopeptidase family protein [Candidatus Colwellbacteria bacterium]|nr:peptidoglycan DD-metalloendopeptidase family protein [Candidatus Colwellbacteria bacterium]